jgi:hypothetical protein
VLSLSAGLADAETSLELALHLPNLSPTTMKDVARALERKRVQLVRILVFQEGASSTPERLLKLALKHLSALHVPIGGGTNADFYQLNQFRPPVELCDFICWSMNPQVHAFDNVSLAETASAIPAQIESARQYFAGKPLVVSPLTLKPRFNPVATGKELGFGPGELPPQVDPRQMSLCGAGWTLAAFKHLAESGADSVTFYETTGWRGVMATEAGSPLSEKFPSIPGAVFPLYHVLADVGEFSGGQVVACKSSKALTVEGMVLRKGASRAMLLANMTDQSQVARVAGLPPAVRVRSLDETNVIAAMTEPERFRQHPGEMVNGLVGPLEVDLRPYAVARIDWMVCR